MNDVLTETQTDSSTISLPSYSALCTSKNFFLYT